MKISNVLSIVTSLLVMLSGIALAGNTHVAGQYDELVSIPKSCNFLRDKGLIVARSPTYDIVYSYDNTITMECCLSKLPRGRSSFTEIVKKVCIHNGDTGWSVSSSPNHYMDPMKIYLPGHRRELDAYYAALRLVTQ